MGCVLPQCAGSYSAQTRLLDRVRTLLYAASHADCNEVTQGAIAASAPVRAFASRLNPSFVPSSFWEVSLPAPKCTHASFSPLLCLNSPPPCLASSCVLQILAPDSSCSIRLHAEADGVSRLSRVDVAYFDRATNGILLSTDYSHVMGYWLVMTSGFHFGIMVLFQ